MSTHKSPQILKEHLDHALFSLDFPKPDFQGKVRDIYEYKNSIFLVCTDRVSAFDQVLGTIPIKGALLTEQAYYWFDQTKHICPNHVISRPDPQVLECLKAQAIPVEVIIRGYLAGSLMREDKFSRGSRWGLKLDPNIKNYQKFEKPILTPTTKAHTGHDQPISREEIISSKIISKKHWDQIEKIALELFTLGTKLAQKQNLLLVDTKYEFGLLNNKIILIDEIHTSDSSRYFIKQDYDSNFAQNKTPKMLDKEFLRQHIINLGINPDTHDFSNFTLDSDLKLNISHRYCQLTEHLTGLKFQTPEIPAGIRVPKWAQNNLTFPVAAAELQNSQLQPLGPN